jgi:hypothetical protein
MQLLVGRLAVMWHLIWRSLSQQDKSNQRLNPMMMDEDIKKLELQAD